MVWKSLFLKMKFNTLDLHGIKHADVNIEVENYNKESLTEAHGTC